MKSINLPMNSFSDQMAENQLSKFSRPEFLSKSNNFSDALRKTEEENEEKNKENKTDLHIQKLIKKIESELSVGSENNFEELAGNELETSLFSIATNPRAIKDNFSPENLSSSQKLDKSSEFQLNNRDEQVTKEVSKALEKDFDKNIKSKSFLKLDESFKLQDQNEKMNLNNSPMQLGEGKVKGQKQRLGVNISDLQSKNNLSLQKSLRSKNIENKSKLGALKATQIYEKQQPVESNKSENKLQNNEVNLVNAGKLKLAKPVASITKTNSDSLKNDLMPQAPSNLERSETENVGNKDFSKILQMKNQFQAEGVDDIIQNAQLLAGKGGGELKLLLNPKDLGSVQLKVFMEGNQLKVEMTTETKEAQEVIESTLGDLRKALAENNLDIESISIDSFNEIDEILQKEQELSQNEYAKDFLSEFKQENNAWRQGMVGFPSVRERKSQVIEQPEISSTQTIKSDRKLDLVA